jgi:hypothetical protein
MLLQHLSTQLFTSYNVSVSWNDCFYFPSTVFRTTACNESRNAFECISFVRLYHEIHVKGIEQFIHAYFPCSVEEEKLAKYNTVDEQTHGQLT